MLKKYFVLFLALSLFSTQAFSRQNEREARRQGTETGNAMGAQLSGDAQAGQGIQQTETDTIKEASVDNARNGQKGQAVAYIMAGALGAAAQKKFEVCASASYGIGVAYAACIAGGILIGMALQSKESGESFNGPNAASWKNVCEYSSNSCSGPMPNPYSELVDKKANEVAIEKARILAESKGIKVDAKTGIVKLKEGKKIDPNDPASMSAALGGEGMSELMKSVSEIEKNAVAKVEQVKAGSEAYGFNSGGAGFGMALAEGGYGMGEDVVGAGASSTNRIRKPAQVKGLTKNFNGDPIGVSGDDIFGMMKRRYILKSNQKTFFGPELQ
jgi:hypothetical protein